MISRLKFGFWHLHRLMIIAVYPDLSDCSERNDMKNCKKKKKGKPNTHISQNRLLRETGPTESVCPITTTSGAQPTLEFGRRVEKGPCRNKTACVCFCVRLNGFSSPFSFSLSQHSLCLLCLRSFLWLQQASLPHTQLSASHLLGKERVRPESIQLLS